MIDFCSSYRHADEEIQARLLKFESLWAKTQDQLSLLKQLSAEMSESYGSINLRTTEQLYSQFKITWEKLRGSVSILQ